MYCAETHHSNLARGIPLVSRRGGSNSGPLLKMRCDRRGSQGRPYVGFEKAPPGGRRQLLEYNSKISTAFCNMINAIATKDRKLYRDDALLKGRPSARLVRKSDKSQRRGAGGFAKWEFPRFLMRSWAGVRPEQTLSGASPLWILEPPRQTRTCSKPWGISSRTKWGLRLGRTIRFPTLKNIYRISPSRTKHFAYNMGACRQRLRRNCLVNVFLRNHRRIMGGNGWRYRGSAHAGFL